MCSTLRFFGMKSVLQIKYIIIIIYHYRFIFTLFMFQIYLMLFRTMVQTLFCFFCENCHLKLALKYFFQMF